MELLIKYTRRVTLSVFLASMALSAHGQVSADQTVYATPSFSLKDDNLKANTKGVNVDALLLTALKQGLPSKSEFETNAEFADKLRRFSLKAFPSAVTSSGNLAIIHPIASFPSLWLGGNETVETHYSPETEVLSVKLSSWIGCLPLARTKTPKRTYSAKNGFGQQVTVLEIDVSETCIDIAEGSQIDFDKVSFAVDLPRKDAPKFKSKLAIAIIGRLAAPFAKAERSHDKPTMRQPLESNILRKSLTISIEDVWLIDSGTGQVLAKSRLPLTNSKPSLVGGFHYSLDGGCKHPDYRKSELPNFDLVVELDVGVSADGRVTDLAVKRSTGVEALDKRAADAVLRCKFNPATKDGQPIDGRAAVKFHFSDYYAGNY